MACEKLRQRKHDVGIRRCNYDKQTAPLAPFVFETLDGCDLPGIARLVVTIDLVGPLIRLAEKDPSFGFAAEENLEYGYWPTGQTEKFILLGTAEIRKSTTSRSSWSISYKEVR